MQSSAVLLHGIAVKGENLFVIVGLKTIFLKESLKSSNAPIICSFGICPLFIVGRTAAGKRTRHSFCMVNSHPPFLFPAFILTPISLLLYSMSQCGFSPSLLLSSPFTVFLLHPLPLAHYIPTCSLAGRVFNMLLLHSADYSNTA